MSDIGRRNPRTADSYGALSEDKSFEAIRLLLEELQEKYKTPFHELLKIIAAKEGEYGILVPVTALSDRKLGMLQCLVKYLKENMGRSFSQIASDLQRDNRTVWVTYHQAMKKSKERIKPEPTKHYLPLYVFADRNFGPVEAATRFLRENENLGYTAIARLLNRNPRSIWTSYRNAAKKAEAEKKTL